MNEKYKLIKYEFNNQLIDVYFDVLNNTIWMSQDNIAKLFFKSKSTINEQINRLKNSDYHFENFDIKFGKTEFSRSKNHYSLDVITSLCKNNISKDFALFKKWVNDNLKQLTDNQIVNENKYNIVVFNDENLSLEVNVDYFNETVWLTQEQIALLFQTERSVIVKHIKNIYLERELDLLSTCAKNAQVQLEGNRYVTRIIKRYNLDMIISIGYRVNSKRGILFRRWANKILKEYLLKGYSINDKRCLSCQESIIDLNNKVNTLIDKSNIHDKQLYDITHVEDLFISKLFYEDEIYDGYSFTKQLFLKANNEIIIIDGYIDLSVLDMLNDIKVNIIIITFDSAPISKKDIQMFSNSHNIKVIRNNKIHDRFVIIDDIVYVFGSSLKDLGKKRTLVYKHKSITKEMLLN